MKTQWTLGLRIAAGGCFVFILALFISLVVELFEQKTSADKEMARLVAKNFVGLRAVSVTCEVRKIGGGEMVPCVATGKLLDGSEMTIHALCSSQTTASRNPGCTPIPPPLKVEKKEWM